MKSKYLFVAFSLVVVSLNVKAGTADRQVASGRQRAVKPGYATPTPTPPKQSGRRRIVRPVEPTPTATPSTPTPTPAIPTPTPMPTPNPLPFTKQVLAGYQGWFAAAGDGSRNIWVHWAAGEVPRKGNVTFELYPDMREYAEEDLFQTNLAPLPNGMPAKLYSSSREGVIDTHFRWMKEYGIDGVAVTRFLIASKWQDATDTLNLTHERAIKAAEKYGRSYFVYYDLSGFDDVKEGPDLFEALKKDLEESVEGKVNALKTPMYVKEDGRPVIGIWGFGFGHNNYTTDEARRVIQWLHDKGYYVIGGVPANWRTQDMENPTKPQWLPIFKMMDMVQPWSVGVYYDNATIISNYNNLWIADKAFCDRNGMDYQRVMFPGFAWSNWVPNAGHNEIPRNGGDFFWKQAYYIKKLGSSAFVAMFDEFDEGTAIAKAAENSSMIPSDQYFLTLDADGYSMSSDFYLRLTGEATKMLQGKRTTVDKVPIPFWKK